MCSVRVCLRRVKALIAGIAILAAGCVDAMLPPRAHDINQSTQNVRESAILLNLVRASRSEPLNFIALSKFTGTGSVNFNQSFLDNNLRKFGTPTNVFIGGATSTAVGGGQGNSFDVGTLENRDFYGGFMSPLDLESLNLLMNAGLNREIVFHSVLHGVRVANRRGEPFLFENKPDDDSWTEGDHVERNSPKCKALYPGSGRAGEANFEPILRTPIWQSPHERDCRYQKFLFFLRLAVRYGITVEAVPLSGKAGGRGRIGAAPKASSPRGGRDKDADGPSARYVVCFDPAIARENGLPGGQIDAPGACGRSQKDLAGLGGENEFRFLFHESIGGVVPIVRSPYAVFQFYGDLLQSHAAHVRLSDHSLRKDRQREARLLTIERGGLDCFARTIYGGTDYCVPNHQSKNTKEIFVLLNTLVALSTNRSALPISPTFVLTP